DEPEQTEPAADLYMVTCRTLNVRTGGSTAFSKLGTISRGTVISGTLENGWVKFTYNGQTAYCSADYLQKVDGDLSGLHVTCRTLNVRAGAGTNFQILGTLSRGTEIDVLEALNGWYKINFLGGVGYVFAAYIG
ncbi:MAG: SH3 domain-containing protein, partial [Candidatus Spyradocola sp.]